MRTIKGEIILPDTGIPPGPAEVIVSVEDVSRADAPSEIIGEQRQKAVALRPGARLPFAVEVPSELVDERHSYSVRAHIDRSGSGEVEVGDLVSTETYPVLSRGRGTSAIVKVKRV